MKTPAPTKAEKNHAAKVGKPFDDELIAATLCVRSNAKLLAADKLRACIAWQAALAVTGYEREVDGFVLPANGCGDLLQETQDIASALFREACEAARDNARKVVRMADGAV